MFRICLKLRCSQGIIANIIENLHQLQHLVTGNSTEFYRKGRIIQNGELCQNKKKWLKLNSTLRLLSKLGLFYFVVTPSIGKLERQVASSAFHQYEVEEDIRKIPILFNFT